MTLLTETRERFLLTIVAQVPADRVVEIHFFQPIKQGGVESGVAVVAAWPEGQDSEDAAASASAGTEIVEPSESFAEDAAVSIDESAAEEGSGGETQELDASADVPNPAKSRHTIYTARYRLTLKGPDRGKWESNVVAEADAPLVTVDAVVRGVQRRSGDVDDATRLDGDEVRALVEAKRAAQGAA